MNIFTSLKRQIPNLITLGNLTCGVVACYMASQGFLWQAAVCIIAGIFLDFFDGLAARLLGVASPVGKELDSLADVVTSGVAPDEFGPNQTCTRAQIVAFLYLAKDLMPQAPDTL